MQSVSQPDIIGLSIYTLSDNWLQQFYTLAHRLEKHQCSMSGCCFFLSVFQQHKYHISNNNSASRKTSGARKVIMWVCDSNFSCGTKSVLCRVSLKELTNGTSTSFQGGEHREIIASSVSVESQRSPLWFIKSVLWHFLQPMSLCHRKSLR